jgi:low affinity Fe/Cu permease
VPKKTSRVGLFFERFAYRMTLWSGSTWAFVLATAAILAWGITGPIFSFSDTWQLVINTATTIVTFLMVFLIQRSQNKESLAIQLKLNEIVAALEGASNRLINVEDLNEPEVQALHGHYQALVELARKDSALTGSHSVEEAVDRHRRKQRIREAGTCVGEALKTRDRSQPAATDRPPAKGV